MKRPITHLLKTVTCALALGALALNSSQACTSLLLQTKDGGNIYGRTMEFGFELESEGVFVPRGYAMNGAGVPGKPGMKWTSKYAVIGMNAFGAELLVDGINEKGLTGGILYFAPIADYSDPKDVPSSEMLTPWEFISWALMNFETVDEVKEAIGGIKVVTAVLPQLKIVPPFHYVLHDANGNSIVVEPVDGELKVHDNPVGVMTNNPAFPWHMTNLQNYVNLNPMNAPDNKIRGYTIQGSGQGTGWLGLPGDPTSPSRFIRALAYSMTVNTLPSGIESVRLVEHIMNNFDIPIGWVQNKSGKEFDYTQWTAIADIKNRVYYVKTYTNQRLKHIDFDSFDLDAKKAQTAKLTPKLETEPLFK